LDFDDKAFNRPEVRSTYPLVPAIQVVQRLSTMWLIGALSIICSVMIAPLNEMGAISSPSKWQIIASPLLEKYRSVAKKTRSLYSSRPSRQMDAADIVDAVACDTR
jgi:hypothetical protein